MSGLKAAVKGIVAQLRKDDRLAAGVIVWVVLAAVLAAAGAPPALWGGLLLLGAVGAILSMLAPRRGGER